jgi:hypothetical protein
MSEATNHRAVDRLIEGLNAKKPGRHEYGTAPVLRRGQSRLGAFEAEA